MTRDKTHPRMVQLTTATSDVTIIIMAWASACCLEGVGLEIARTPSAVISPLSHAHMKFISYQNDD